MKKRIMSIFLSLCMVAALLPITSVTANAGVASKSSLSLGSEVLFGGKSWRVIGYNGTGAATEAGSMTLLAKDCSAEQVYFDNTRSPVSNEYSGSDLQSAINSSTTFAPREEAAIIPVNLKGGADSHAEDGMSGPDVENAKLWPLSVLEANAVDKGIRTAAKHWWLRSPARAVLNPDITVVSAVKSTGDLIPISMKSNNIYTRAALKLNLSDILYSSNIDGKGSAADGSMWSMYSIYAQKLTILDRTLSAGTVSAFSEGGLVPGTTMKVSTTGATPNKMLSAIVTDGSGTTVKAYGKIANIDSNGAVTGANLTLPVKPDADNVLKLIAEEINSGSLTDYASAPVPLTITIPEETAGDFTVTGPTYNYSFNSGDGVLTVTGDCTIANTDPATATTNRISVFGAPINITLSGVNIASSADAAFAIDDYSEVNLTVTGANTLTSPEDHVSAGLQVPEYSTLTIGGTGTLSATGMAGIGSLSGQNPGEITINSGTINATGGFTQISHTYSGAGIGGSNSRAGRITINGGTVNATGGTTSAGIGSADGDGGTVIINGGNIKAKGGTAAIGKGWNGASSGTIKNTSGTDIYLATFTEPSDNPGKTFSITKANGASYTYDLTKSSPVNENGAKKWYVYLPAGEAEASYDGKTYQTTVNTDNSAVFVKVLSTAAAYGAGAVNAKTTGDYYIDESTTPKTLTLYTSKGAAFWSASGNAYLDYAIKVDTGIDVSDFYWMPVGTKGSPFTGNFDGQGHTIANLNAIVVTKDADGYGGLFGCISGATIQNIGLTQSSVSVTAGKGTAYAGGIAGYANGAAPITIANCYNTGTITGTNAGGIVGLADTTTHAGTITNCYNMGEINGSAMGGGIVGNAGNMTIFGCHNTGAIRGYVVGGIVARTLRADVTNCYNTGAVASGGGGGASGGIAGYADGSITNSYNTGKIDGIYNVAGIVGFVLADDGENLDLANCFNTGAVKEVGIANYLVGSVTNCYDKLGSPSGSINAGGSNVVVSGCGTFDDSGKLTAGEWGAFIANQTLASYADTLINALNGWVAAQASDKYYTWKVGTDGNVVQDKAWTPSYDITASAATNGSYTVKVDGSVVAKAAVGDIVTIAPTASSGYEVDAVSVCKTGETSSTVAVSGSTFTMPGYNVTVSVTFKVKSTPPIGGGSLGGSSTTVPTRGSKATVKSEVSISGSTVTMKEPGAADLNKLIDAASADKKPLEIDLSSLRGSLTSVVLPASLIAAAGKSAQSGGVSGLTVVAPNGSSVTFDRTATTAIAAAANAGTLTLSVNERALSQQTAEETTLLSGKTVANIFDLALNDSVGSVVSGFDGGTATVVLKSVKMTGNLGNYTLFHKTGGKLTAWPFTRTAAGAADVYDLIVPTTGWSSYILTFSGDGNSFADVADSTYYHDAVVWAVGKGITSGTKAATFAPGAACTRAQTVTFLWRAMGSPEPTSTVNPFTDVSGDAYYCKAVLWAAEKGITLGTSSTTFSPDTTVTRGQTMTFLWCAAGKGAASVPNPFGDVKNDAYYADAVSWAVSAGITSGTRTGAFSPANSCTRAQIVTFLYRYLSK